MAESAGYYTPVYDKTMRDVGAVLHAHSEAVRRAVEPLEHLDLTTMYPLLERVPDDAASKTTIGTSTADRAQPRSTEEHDRNYDRAQHLRELNTRAEALRAQADAYLARAEAQLTREPTFTTRSVTVRAGATFVVDSLIYHGRVFDGRVYDLDTATVTLGELAEAALSRPFGARLLLLPGVLHHKEDPAGQHGTVLYVHVRALGNNRTDVEFTTRDLSTIDPVAELVDPLIAGLDHDWPRMPAKEPEAVPSVEAAVFYSFDIEADLEAVAKTLYDVSGRRRPTVGLEADGMPTGGTITYGPLRPATSLDQRWVEERFDRFFELPSTITWRKGDEPMPYGLTYVGLRRLDDRRTAVRMIGLKTNQLSVMTDLLERLKKDYPGIADKVDRQMGDLPKAQTPTTTDAATIGRRRDNGLTSYATLDALKTRIAETLDGTKSYVLTADLTVDRIGLTRSALYKRLESFGSNWPDLKSWLLATYPQLRCRR